MIRVGVYLFEGLFETCDHAYMICSEPKQNRNLSQSMIVHLRAQNLSYHRILKFGMQEKYRKA